MSSVDKSMAAKEKKVEERSAREAQWKKHSETEATTSSATAVLESSSTNSGNNSTGKFTPKEAQGVCGGARALK